MFDGWYCLAGGLDFPVHFAKVFLFNLEEACPLLCVKNHFCSRLLSENH